MSWPTLTLITDPAVGDDALARIVRQVGEGLPRGSLLVQLRDKSRPRPSLHLFAGQLRRLTHVLGAKLVVNGDAVLARDVDADGIHLGAEAKADARSARAVFGVRAPRVVVSRAAHSDSDVRRALAEGADAVLVSPIYPSRGLRVGAQVKSARGLGALRSARACGGAALSIVGLGGVGPENAGACRAAGADGVAVIRSVLANSDPKAAARAIHDAFARR